MPKQVAEIKQFNSGIIATPDSKDIPADAADYSKDIETIASDGFIKGRKTESYATALGGFSTTTNGIGPITVGLYKAPVSGGGGGGG